MNRRIAFVFSGLAVLVGSAALGTYIAGYFDIPPNAAAMNPANANQVALGEVVYRDHCAACHGANLEGQPDWRRRRADGRLPAPPHDASGHTWHHPPKQLFDLTKYGPAALVGGGYQSDMPAYEGVLSDAEIWAVLSYLKSRWPAEVRARHDQLSQ